MLTLERTGGSSRALGQTATGARFPALPGKGFPVRIARMMSSAEGMGGTPLRFLKGFGSSVRPGPTLHTDMVQSCTSPSGTRRTTWSGGDDFNYHATSLSDDLPETGARAMFSQRRGGRELPGLDRCLEIARLTHVAPSTATAVWGIGWSRPTC